MEALFLVILIAIAISIVAGLIIAAILFAILAVCISAGILATSVFIGLYRRSFSSGFKAWFIITSCIAGMVVMAILLLACHWLSNSWTITTTMFAGGVSGLVVGLTFGYTMVYVLRRTTSYIFRKYSGITNDFKRTSG